MKPCAEHVGAPRLAILEIPMRTLKKLLVSCGTLQYNPFIFVKDFAEPQISELDVDKNADLLYIHITVEE